MAGLADSLRMKPASPSLLPSLSIVLATYNGERYLRQQLESLAAQTVSPCELIVSDDGSGDRTIAILTAFAAAAPFPVRVLQHAERIGYACNFLRAIRLCEGDAVAFCDQDDIWRPNKIERCCREFRRADVGLVVHEAEEVDAELAPCHVRLPGLRRSAVLPKGRVHPRCDWPMGCVMVVRRRVLQEVVRVWPAEHARHLLRPDTPHLVGHDSATYFVARSLAAVSYIAEPLILHRRHANNVTGPRVHFTDSLHASVRTGAHAYRMLAKHASAASELYAAMAAEAQNRDLERDLRRVASRFRRRAGSLEARAALYSTRPRQGRIQAMARMARAGMYDAVRRGGIGRRAMAKDLLWAVLAGGEAARRDRGRDGESR